jgi:hypothetical protein
MCIKNGDLVIRPLLKVLEMSLTTVRDIWKGNHSEMSELNLTRPPRIYITIHTEDALHYKECVFLSFSYMNITIPFFPPPLI